MFPPKLTVRERKAKLSGGREVRYKALLDEHQANEREIEALLRAKAELQQSVREAQEMERESFMDPIKRIKAARAILGRNGAPSGLASQRPATVGGAGTVQQGVFSASLGPTRPPRPKGRSPRSSPRKRPGTAPEPFRAQAQRFVHFSEKDEQVTTKKDLGPGLEIPWRYLSLAPPGEGEEEGEGGREEVEEHRKGGGDDEVKEQGQEDANEMVDPEDLAALFPDVYIPPRRKFFR